MSVTYPNISKSRAERLLEYRKADIPRIVRRKPAKSDGNEGDIAIGNTPNGIRLYVKISNAWYSFSPDKDDALESNVVNFVAESDGTTTFPSKILTSDDSGKTFIIDISSYTALFRLPAVGVSAGVEYTFIMGVESNNEATKDFIVITSADGEDMQGLILHSATTASATVTIKEVINTTSKLTLDGDTTDAPITTGDFVKFICDGINWYLHGITNYANVDDDNTWE